MTYKLTDILKEVISEKLSDDPYKFYRYVKPIQKLLNIKVNDYMSHGSQSTVFSLKDGRVLKLTYDRSDAWGLQWAMENHPNAPVLKVDNVLRIETSTDALGNAMHVYAAVSEKLDTPYSLSDHDTAKIKEWFKNNTDLEVADVHERNIGISSDKSTPLGGLVILDPSFKGKHDTSKIKTVKLYDD